MSYVCNSCFEIIEEEQMVDELVFFTSCFHILCTPCSKRVQNGKCIICETQCNMVTIGEKMPNALKLFFEPPLMKLEKLQKQYEFLKTRDDVTYKMKSTLEEKQKKAEHNIKKVLDLEQQVNAEAERLDKVAKSKIETYPNMRTTLKKTRLEELRWQKYFEDRGWSVDIDVTADSGMHSMEKSKNQENSQ